VRARYLAIPLLAGFALAVMLAAIPALGADQTVTANSSNQVTPKTVTVNQGESVTWSNSGGFHNVKFDDGSFEQPSSPTGPGWMVKRTFNVPGTYGYYCVAHQDQGMTGTVVVNPAPGGTQPTQPGTTQPGSYTNPGSTLDRLAPRLTPKLRKLQRVLRQRAVVLSVAANEAAVVNAVGRVSLPGGKVVQLRRAKRSLAAHARAKLELKLSKKSLAAVRRALRRHRRLAARISVTARDAAGNVRVTKLKLRLTA
jgi:plastocyanin